MHHHALGEQARERLIEVDVAGRAHGAGEEAAIEQVQDGVFDAANILVHRHHPVGHRAIRGIPRPGVREADEIPG